MRPLTTDRQVSPYHAERAAWACDLLGQRSAPGEEGGSNSYSLIRRNRRAAKNLRGQFTI